MSTNPYFQQLTYPNEQRLWEDLVIESIQIHGIDVKYLPRTLIKQDFIFGEDALSKFNLAVDIEVYVKSNTSFEGDGDFLSKFNLEIRDQLVLTMSRKRWSQIATEKILLEEGQTLQLESANTNVWGNSIALRIESGTANGYSITSPRPMEGDLIYFPLNKKLFEIKFVEHEAIFYQNGKLYTYDITCELFDRDSRLDTGNTQIDSIETNFSMDILFNEILLENGDSLLNENGGYIIGEFRLENTAPGANNEAFMQESQGVVNFDEINPFLLMDD